MNTTNQFVTVWLPRITGILAGYAVGEAAKHGITLDQEQVNALMIATYFTVHRLLSRWLNPGDSAKTALVEHQKAVVAAGDKPDAKAIRETLERVAGAGRD